MSTAAEKFGSMVFDESVMKERLPKETFKQLQRTMKDGRSLDINIANVVANAMKELRRLRLEEEALLKKQRESSTASEETSN